MNEDAVNLTFELDHIDQQTIECDLRAFTSWLNHLVDQLNYTTKIAIYAKDLAESNERRICLLEKRVDKIEKDIIELGDRVTIVEGDIINIKKDIEVLNKVIDQVNSRVDMLFSWLPIPYGMIDPKGWKFAMGNINVMSNNNGTPSLDIGLFTSQQIENNDIYFN